MNFIKTYILATAVAVGALAASAQDTNPQQQSSASGLTRRSRADRDKQEQTSAPGVTDRMAQRMTSGNTDDAAKMWMRVIYRDLDLTNAKNAPLYFPEEIVDGQENLFRILMRLLAENKIPAYEYLDGKEVFTDQYRLKVADMLDRFHVLNTPAKGSTEKNPLFVIEESDVPCNEVLSYYIIERWEFDSRRNKTRRTVDAICPVLHRTDDFGGEAIRYPMFWVKMDDIRPYLAQQSVFVDDDNNLPRYSYDDFFTLSMFDGDIYKTRNLQNKSMMQQFPDPDERKKAQDSIQTRLESFDKNMWVPSREEVIAAREAREEAEAAAEAAAEGTEIASRDGSAADSAQAEAATTTPAKTVTRSARGKKSTSAKQKETKQKKAKQPKQPKASKPKSSSSNAVRSVRRRK